MDNWEVNEGLEPIAVIGMAGRFPGANDIDEFWQNLRDGVESITFFSDEELAAAGVDPELLSQPNYVKANGVLNDIESFDAAFFGMTPREVQVMDPQHRLLLECTWIALEQSGYDALTYDGRIGLFAGACMSTYLQKNLLTNPDLLKLMDFDLVQQQDKISQGNDRDYLTTRISYKLGLTGPSVSVNTVCSTSLVAVHLACQSLLNYQCDIALAGGASIQVSQEEGYLYKEGSITSPDGHCRAFDANAQGTIFGNGVGMVALKRLEDAIADGDYIYAVIKGTAINNDGALKVSYTAPSVEGQAAAIAEAQAVAGVDPATITYIEAHGTGTALGDPIEMTALNQVFQASTDKKQFCAIGTVKTNIGHLNRAAGIAGSIKTILALQHKQIPPSLHYKSPNPAIDFANSPFFVNTQLRDWETDGIPRRAGLSSFGFGGTNAHMVLEEAPQITPSGPSQPPYLLVLSAKTEPALQAATQNLSEYLKQHPDVNLADVAYTLQVGRRSFKYRRTVVCQNREDAIAALASLDSKRVSTAAASSDRPVVFMFSGQGSQYVNMARELYDTEPVFRQEVDRACDILQPHLGLDLRHILYPSADDISAATEQLKQTSITQPALFVIEYAVAQLWMSWGVQPQATIGHSIGEYVAACIAGVFSLEDALALVAARGKLMQQLPAGTMLAVPLTEAQVQPFLTSELSLAVINGPSRCVISGTAAAIEGLEQQLAAADVEGRRLHTSHAFHSHMMEPILEPFTALVQNITLNAPQLPYVSNVTGTWITDEQATDPRYWATHLRQTVRFAEGVQQFFAEPDQILLEVGPGRTLSTLALQHPQKPSEQVVLTSVRHPQDSPGDRAFLLTTLGKLWLMGTSIEWSNFYVNEQRHRLPLPTYPFQKQWYWIEAGNPEQQVTKGRSIAPNSNPILDSLLQGHWEKITQKLEAIEQLSEEEVKQQIAAASY